jgi:hypothetical protein
MASPSSFNQVRRSSLSFNSRTLRDIALVAATFVAVGCKQEKSKLDDFAPAAPTAPAASANSSDVQAFCEQTLQKVFTCFEDAGFWDNFATTWFAKYPDTTGNPDAKKEWIGMRKDDLVGVKRDNQIAQNCQVMVRLNKLPTAQDIEAVTGAMKSSCSAYGTAMGVMLFHNGVFHEPRG